MMPSAGSASLAVLAALLVGAPVSAEDANYKCKDASSDWPLPCLSPAERYLPRMRIADRLPISAWWGPVGYDAGGDSTAEFEAYAAAGFTNVQVSDRGAERCDDWKESWDFVVSNIEHAARHNLTVLLDTYRCLPWGGVENEGGDAQGPTNAYVRPHSNHKITLPEVKWLATAARRFENVVGLLITDDGADLARNEVSEIEWMLRHTPELLPWVNQCADGTDWLARAGTPYAVPELYAVNPGTQAKNVTAVEEQCAQQLGGYDTWSAKSQRFGLRQFPLINIGDGGDTGLVRSESLVRFQAYAALAMGAKGLMWYCWGNGAWNLTTQTPTSIYGALREVNHKVQGWSDALLEFPHFAAAYHSSTERLAGPAFSSRAAGQNELLLSMSEQLMVGVLDGKPCEGQLCELLLVVVDKRVNGTLAPEPPRTVEVELSAVMRAATLVGGGRDDVHFFGEPIVKLSVTLGGGDGAVFRVQGGAAMLDLAHGLPQWRFDVERPSLAPLRTSQYNFYQYGFEAREQTTLILGAADVDQPGRTAALASAGFNAVLGEADNETLNDAMRNGAFVLQTANKPWAVEELEEMVDRVGCHPAFGGVALAPTLPLNSTPPADLAALRPVVERFRSLAPQALSILFGRGAVPQLLLAGNRSTAPIVAIALTAEHAPPNATAEFARLWGSGQGFLVLNEGLCGTTAASIRFRTFAALLYGARGVIQSGCLDRAVFAEMNAELAHIGDTLGGMRLQTVHSTLGWHVAQVEPFVENSTVVVGMSEDLLLGIQTNHGAPAATPPMLMVVDGRQGDARTAREETRRVVEVRLGPSCIGWTPMVGCAERGFKGCAKFVLGRTVRVSLAPGEGLLVALTMVDSESREATK